MKQSDQELCDIHQVYIDEEWEKRKQRYFRLGFSEREMLLAELGLRSSDRCLPTEIKQQKDRINSIISNWIKKDMKHSDQELCARLAKILEKIDPNYIPLVISPITIEAIDKEKNNPGYIWLCLGGWAWQNFEIDEGGSGLDMINAWRALTESLQSNQ